MLVTELLDIGESPSKKYDWNEALYVNNQNNLNQMRNISCESIEFNEEDMDENPEVKNQDCDIGDSNSDKDVPIQSNLDLKMKNMQGYNFKNNENFKAMKKIVINPLVYAGHVEIKSDHIEKMKENKLSY